MASEPTGTLSTVAAYPRVHEHSGQPLQWIKADLHLHTAEDPLDEVDYSAVELLERAAQLGYHALAVTLHDKVFDDQAVFERARELGILLIPAAELRIEGADSVLLNVSVAEAAQIQSFDDLRRLRAQRGESLLVFAPHPFYRLGGSIGERIHGLLDCFDAIEYCHFHIPFFNPNAAAVRLAQRTGKPLVATSDAHRRQFFGQNYSLLGIPAGDDVTTESVFAAIRADRVRCVSPRGGLAKFFGMLLFLFVVHPILLRLPGAKRRRELAGAGGAPARAEATISA